MAAELLKALVDFFFPTPQETAITTKMTTEDVRRLLVPRIIPCGDHRATALLPYRSLSVKAMLWALKYRNSAHAAELLAKALADTLAEEWIEIELRPAPIRIVAVPRSAENAKKYSGNHLERVVAKLNEPFRAAVLPRALARAPHARPQTTLKRKERLVNMQGALSVANPERIAGAHVIAIDDVVTTGATLQEAARALQGAGAKSITLFALAYS